MQSKGSTVVPTQPIHVLPILQAKKTISVNNKNKGKTLLQDALIFLQFLIHQVSVFD